MYEESEENKSTEAIKSHIQMPRLLLKRFHDEHNRFHYYDVKNKFIGNRGTAKSINTELGYYSIFTEEFLRDEIETPFGEILKFIDAVDFDRENFSVDLGFEIKVLNFIYSLLTRNPDMLKKIDNQTVYSQFLVERSKHDYMAINGVDIARENKIFYDYVLTFTINRTKVPFVLPIGGIYSYGLNGRSVINLPISPWVAISLVHNEYAHELIHDDGVMSLLLVECSNIIKTMNNAAFRIQQQYNWGYVICPEREELERLKNDFQ